MTSAPLGESSPRPGEPCIVVIFGSAGDLTKRKLIPALYNLCGYKLLPSRFAVIGVARRDLGDEEFRNQMSAELVQHGPSGVSEAQARDFTSRLHFVAGDFDDAQTYQRLRERIDELSKRYELPGNVLFYLATPPNYFGEIAKQLGASKLGAQGSDGRPWRRLVIEKPFGHDLDSALELNDTLRGAFRENQLYRIDHYLGKETVQNLLVFRFANGIFEPIWNRRYIDHVQICVAETLGVEGRGGYYDKSGVLRDMIQNHMFQLLSLVAMEPPSSLQGEGVRNEKLKVLEAIRPLSPEEILQNTVRGQYGPGEHEGQILPGYRQEPNVALNSKTETYAALRLEVENWRWAGVPFYLRSGKRLARRATEIVITFRRPPLLLFKQMAVEEIEPNRIVVRIQPEEGISLWVKAKRPGPSLHLTPVRLDFSYREFGGDMEATGYEQLLYDVMIGDPTLFHRADMVEASWRVATPILDLWSTLPVRDFPNYNAGGWGPAAADHLLSREGRRWSHPE